MAYMIDYTIMLSSSDCEIKYNIANSIVEIWLFKTTMGRRSIEDIELALKINLRISVFEGGRQLENVQDTGLYVM